MTLLDRYWPRQEEIDRCIKAEAETASEAILLAVHQPMPLATRNAGSQVESPATESEFLEGFLVPDLPEGTLLQAVTGASGAGKSHLIRWLAAQLQRDPRAEQMLIIRIPKSASLRTVVELILEPLAGDERYARARADLQQAVAEVTPETGAIRLAAGLEIALRELAERLTTELRADPQSPKQRELKTHLDHARRLPTFFNDAALEDHFKPNVLARIVDRAVRGSDQPLEDAPLPQFTADDLKVPGNVDLGQASQQVRNYYQTILNREGGQGFERAAEVLNQVVDQAIREAFRLGQAMGGVTLEEVILHIRQLLFEDDRELILLVEDFAALSGIQEVLLRVCIQEAVRDGKLVRAPMRTALAVTDGYLASRDTILTRAKREWIVKTTLSSEEDVISGTRGIVAAYLNAARWGSDELETRYQAGDLAGDLTGWITIFQDENLSAEEAPLLDAFGQGPRDVPLFPYNDAAVRSFASRHLSVGGRLHFLPRRIINYILRDVLIRRGEFERGLFPPPAFEGANPTFEIANWLSRAVPQAEIRNRVASLLVHWGGNPENAGAAASLPPGLFRAFGLPTPQDLGEESNPIPPESPPKGPTPPEPPQSPPKPEPPVNPEVAAWRKRLEDWTGGERLGQQHARYLREAIKALLLKAINWNEIRLRDSVSPSLLIVIPNAAGNDAPAQMRLEIAEDSSDPDGNLRRSLMAIIRFVSNNRDWHYDGGDEDSAIVANFIDGLVERFTAEVELRAEAEAKRLADLLVQQARVLGIRVQGIGRPVGLGRVVRAPCPEHVWAEMPDGSAEGRWQELQKNAQRTRPNLQEMLVARLGCFQGRGNTAYAIDLIRLSEARKRGADQAPRELEQGELAAHATDLREIRLKVRVEPFAQNLRKFHNEMLKALGEPFNKDAYIGEAKEFLAVVERAGVWPRQGFVKSDVSQAIEDFRNTALMEQFDRIRRLSSGSDGAPSKLEEILAVVSQIDLSVVERAQRFVRDMTSFLNAVDQVIEQREQMGGAVDPLAKADKLESKLQGIADGIERLLQLEEVEQ